MDENTAKRDPARVDRTVDLLRKAWTELPEFRLGQLFSMAADFDEVPPELFYVSDERLESGLANVLRWAKDRRSEKPHD